MRFESKRGLKRKRKKTFCKLESFFFSCYFSITPFPLHFKDDFQSLIKHSIDILNHSKWSTYDINKCSIIGKWSRMAGLPYKAFKTLLPSLWHVAKFGLVFMWRILCPPTSWNWKSKTCYWELWKPPDGLHIYRLKSEFTLFQGCTLFQVQCRRHFTSALAMRSVFLNFVMLLKWWSSINIFSHIWQCSQYESRLVQAICYEESLTFYWYRWFVINNLHHLQSV
jgi:hypothetical protein